MDNQISKDFNFTSLIMFAIPSISMMIFTSLYGIVDGIFVSRFVSTQALSAFNIVYPFINVVIGIGVMLATGASAIIARKLGERKDDEARSNFTFIVISGIVIGIIMSLIGSLFLEPMIYALGSTKDLYIYCELYLKSTFMFVPAYIVNLLYQFFTITAGKPKVGLFLTILGGVSNIILDYVFIVPLDMGISGAAIATGLGNLIPTVLGTIYFIKYSDTLYFSKFKVELSMFLETCKNGSSEMVSNLAAGITTILFNYAMIKYAGADGVAAMSIVLYGQFLIIATYIGFTSGVAPILSYNYGEGNYNQIKKIVGYAIKFLGITSVVVYLVSILSASTILQVFTDKGTNVYELGYRGFLIFGTSFLITSISIFISGMFTAFSNGKISAIISFFRTFVFIVIGVTVFPIIWGIDGIWISVPIAEGLSAIMAIYFFRKYKVTYKY